MYPGADLMGGTAELMTIPSLLCLGATLPSQVRSGILCHFALGSSQFSGVEGRFKTPDSAPRPTITRLPTPWLCTPPHRYDHRKLVIITWTDHKH